jgi:hypothetical protein
MFAKLFSIILALMFLAATVQAQEFVTDGLVGMWTLDKADIDGDIVKDASDNGNDATIVGSLDSVEGVIGEALEFVGAAENYVQIPALGAWEQVSVECWVLTKDLSPTYQGIISTWQWAAGKVHFKFESSQIQVHKNDGVKITAPAEIDAWYHVIYTTDTAANEIKLYVGGELIAEGTTGAAPENMDERRIGSEHDGRWLVGMVDEVRIYNRVLELEEVEQNFATKLNTFAVTSTGKLAASWGKIKSLED